MNNNLDAEIIMEGNLKLSFFTTFPYEELREHLDYFKSKGYVITFVENGYIVLQKEKKI